MPAACYILTHIYCLPSQIGTKPLFRRQLNVPFWKFAGNLCGSCFHCTWIFWNMHLNQAEGVRREWNIYLIYCRCYYFAHVSTTFNELVSACAGRSAQQPWQLNLRPSLANQKGSRSQSPNSSSFALFKNEEKLVEITCAATHQSAEFFHHSALQEFQGIWNLWLVLVGSKEMWPGPQALTFDLHHCWHILPWFNLSAIQGSPPFVQ